MDKVIRHGLEIAAGLDKASQKEMRQVVRDIFVEEAHIDFNNPENVKGLRALADIMKKMFQQAGNTKFDFAKMIELPGPELFDGLKEAAMEFDDVWSNIVQKFGKQSLKDVFMKDQSDLSMALSRLTDKEGKLVKNRIKNIEKAFKEVKFTDINKLLNEAMGAETEFRNAESWEEQTAAALRYLNVYEQISKIKNRGDFDVLDIERHLMPVYKNIDNLGSYAVSTLKDVVPQMQTSLQNIFNLASGKPLIGLTEGGKIDFEVVPTVIKTLDVSDVLGGKANLEIPVVFRTKLDLMRDLSEEGDFDQLEKLQDEIVSMFPEGVQDAVLERLEKFAQLEKTTARSYQAIWKDLVGYGMPVGDGAGGFGTGTGDGAGSGDASSAELKAERARAEALQAEKDALQERLQKQADEAADEAYHHQEERAELYGRISEAEESADTYRRAMDSMQEEMDALRGRLADAGTGAGGGGVGGDNVLQQLQKDAEAASRAFEDAHNKLSDIIQAEQELDWQLTSRGFVDYGQKYQETATIKKQELDNLRRSFTKKSDHKSNVATVEEIIRSLINNEALSPLGVFSDPKDLSEFVDYKFAVEDGKATNKVLNDLLNSLINKLQREVSETMDTYKSWGDIQSRDNPDADLLIQKRRKLAEEHAAATKAYNEAADARSEAYDKLHVAQERGGSTGARDSRTEEDVENARKVAEYEAQARADAEAKEKADERRNELAEQLELYADDGTGFDLEESEAQKAALQEILNTLKQESLLTDELQARYDAINSKIDERISLLKSVRQAYDSLETADNIDYNMYDADEVQQALDKRKEIINAIPRNVLDNDDDIADWVEEIEQGNLELEKRIGLLQQVKQGLIDIDSVDDIMSESGDLDSKLSRLQDVASAWGSDIKDADVDEDDEALEALQEFEATYDRIVLKLANGRKIEILPNAKGLRALHKYDDGIDSSAYGETEIEDIEFVRKAIKQETNAISEQNEELKENANLKNQSGGAGTGQTDGATAEEVENLEKVRAKVAEIITAVETKTNAFKTEGTEVGNVVDGEIAKLGELENKIASIKVTLEGLLNNIKTGADDVGAGLSNITVNVNHQKDEEQDKPTSIDKEALRQTLADVVYNVKIAHDDNDKQANKIAIDAEALEGVLRRVFADKPGIDATTGAQDASAKAQTDGLVTQYKRAIATIAEWQTLYQSLNNLPNTNKPAEQRKNILNALQGVTPELAHMIGGAFEEAFKTGFKGFKTKDIARYVGRIAEESLFGSVPEQVEMLRGVDAENFDFDKLPIQKASLDSLTPVFELLHQIDAINKGVGVGGLADTLNGDLVEQPKESYALEKTLLDVKGVLDKIAKNTASLNGVEIQRAVEANTNATEQVAPAVAAEVNSATSGSKLGKVAEKYSSDESDVPFRRVETENSKTSKSYRTTKTHKRPIVDEEGNWTGDYDVDLVEVIDDYDKIRKENDKTQKAVERAQKKVNEFVAKFDSKTGGNAKFIDGFSELKGFTVTADNIDAVYNKMIMLQQKYAELEKNFRKGQSSLNPFVNAINKSQNIGNIFGDVETKFDGLVVKSDELTANFNELKKLSEQIQAFTQRMETDPSSITPADFTEFSRQMGEFTSLKTQVDSMIRSETSKNKEIRTHNAQVEAEVVKELIKLYEQLGRAQATGDEDEASRLRGVISAERDKLSSVDYATDMKFKDAKSKGFEAERTQAENAALKEKETTIQRLSKLYQEYGVLVERANAIEGTALAAQIASEAKNKFAEIEDIQASLGDIDPNIQKQFDEAFDKGKAIESEKQYAALAKKDDAEEVARLNKIEGLEKEIGKLRAEADATTNVGVKNALEEEIKLRESLIELQKQGLKMDAQDEAYYRQVAANRTKQAKKNSTQETRDRKEAFKDAKKMAQREAMLGKAGTAVGRAENTWMSAVGLEGKLPADFIADIDKYYKKLDALRKTHQDLKNSDMISEEQKKDLIDQTININKMTEEIGELVSEYQRLSGDNVDKKKIKTTTLTNNSPLSDYEAELKQYVRSIENGKAQIKNFDAATKTLTYTVKTGKNEFTEYTAAVRRADGALVSVQGATKRTETFLEATKRKMKELTSYMSGMALFSRATQELRKGIQYVREIDLALTELKKVTDETEKTYDKFLDTAAKTGARLGTTISAVTEATATFAKLGYSMEQATEMAESAIVYKNVGDNIASTEDAADSIISTMKGFRLEATESMRIVDRFNEVGNKFAITSQGIGEALRLSASALSEGGNSLDESIALITGANEVVNDPSSVGTALKTLTLRLRGSKTELEEMGEDVTDMATTTSQLQAKLLALTGGQVDIMLDANTFKNSTQILREMAEAWGDMNDIQRASALELMGGRLLPLYIEICA